MLEIKTESFGTAKGALARLTSIYERCIANLQHSFERFANGEELTERVTEFYPSVRIDSKNADRIDNRKTYGFVAGPGSYEAMLTRPDLFADYYLEQFDLLLKNHGTPLQVGLSDIPIPIHFAYPEGIHVEGNLDPDRARQIQTIFDVPDLYYMDDRIVNGTFVSKDDNPLPLAHFCGPRVDYSLHRLMHYTATSPKHFQNFVLFTNYQFYVDEFIRMSHEIMRHTDDAELKEYRSGYSAFVEPGDFITHNKNTSHLMAEGDRQDDMPQMPAYHLKRPDGNGITMVNIGVGPSNAKTITDHIAVLRPSAWLMLGHCAGLRNTQRLGDYVLAHGYVREDHVLDADVPLWIPIPPLAEIQQALEGAMSRVTGLSGYDLKRIMRTGTVATIDDRNWELRNYRMPLQRFNQSRAIALDMESATIAANGFRFRVPYGTLLCVSDRPVHGELKLSGMANDFYSRQVAQHLKIGVAAMEILRESGSNKLHSRKLRSFDEVAFR